VLSRDEGRSSTEACLSLRVIFLGFGGLDVAAFEVTAVWTVGAAKKTYRVG